MASVQDINDLCDRFAGLVLHSSQDTKESLLFKETVLDLPPKEFWHLIMKELLAHFSIVEVRFGVSESISKVTLLALISLKVKVMPKDLFAYLKRVEAAHIDLQCVEQEGFSPYHMAALTNREDLFHEASGLNPDSLDYKGRSALQLAAFFGHAKIAERLITCGATADLCTPLFGFAHTQAVLARQHKIATLLRCNGRSGKQVFDYTPYQKELVMRTRRVRRGDPIDQIATILFEFRQPRELEKRQYYYSVIEASGEKELLESYYRYETVLRTLYHSWNIDWTITASRHLYAPHKIVYKDETRSIVFSPLSGSYGAFFLHKLAKGTKRYIQCMEEDAPSLQELAEALEFTSNQPHLEPAALLARYKNGKPLIIAVEFNGNPGHITYVLIWKNYFVLCNRGLASRKSIEVATFQPSRLDEEILRLLKSPIPSENAFRSFLFQVIPKKLRFYRNEHTYTLEKELALPLQTIDNCGFANLEAGCHVLLRLMQATPLTFENLVRYIQLLHLEDHLEMISIPDKPFVSNFEMNYSIYQTFQQFKKETWLNPCVLAKMEEIETHYPIFATFAFAHASC